MRIGEICTVGLLRDVVRTALTKFYET